LCGVWVWGGFVCVGVGGGCFGGCVGGGGGLITVL